MLRVALGWSAWETSRSAFGTGLVAALTMAPPALLAPLFGVVADRVRLRRAVAGVALAFAALAALLGGLSFADRLGYPALALVAGLHGIVAAAWQPLRLTVAARLVPRALLPEAVSLSSVTFQTARVVGPAIAGAAIARFGVAAVYALVALAYLGFAVAVPDGRARAPARRRARRRPVPRAAGGRAARRARDAGRGVRCSSRRSSAARSRAARWSSCRPSRAARSAAVRRRSPGSPRRRASARWRAGSSPRARRADADALRARFVATGAAGSAATFALGLGAELGGGLAGTVAACACVGFFATLTGVACQSLLQLVVGDAYRGRVLSLWTTAGFGGAVLGTLGLGALGDRVGLDAALRLLGAGGVAAFAALAAATRRSRRRIRRPDATSGR